MTLFSLSMYFIIGSFVFYFLTSIPHPNWISCRTAGDVTYRIFVSRPCGPFNSNEPFNDVFRSELSQIQWIGQVADFALQPIVLVISLIAVVTVAIFKSSSLNALDFFTQEKLSENNNTIKAMNDIIQRMRNQIRFLFKEHSDKKNK